MRITMADVEREARAIRRADKGDAGRARAADTGARLRRAPRDEWPYVVPLLYVWRDGEIWPDNSATRGHPRDDVDRDPRVCSRWTNYPRLDQIAIYAIAVDRLTGKETPLPAPEDRWPRAYRTRTPHERP